MQVGSVTSGIGTLNMRTDIGVAVLSKNMDAMETAGEGMIKMIESAPSAAMMERSVNPHIGGNVDMLV